MTVSTHAQNIHMNSAFFNEVENSELFFIALAYTF